MHKSAIVASAVSLMWGVVSAANVYFEAKDGNLSEPANWSTGALPTTADTLCMTNADVNYLRIKDGDSLTVSGLNICQNNNGTVVNSQVIKQTGGTLKTDSSSSSSFFASWPRDRAEYDLSGGLLSINNNEWQICGRGYGIFSMDGGELTVRANYPKIVNNSGQGTLDVRGGAVNVTLGNLYITGQEGGYGYLNVGGTGRVDLEKNLATSSDNGTPTGLLTLTEQGTLSCAGMVNGKGATTYYNLAGGTLEPNMSATEKDAFVTDVNLYVNAGGARVDTKDNRISLAVPLNRGNLRRENLYRRWSFTDGSLVDSIGGVTAEVVGDNVKLADNMVSLPWATPGTAFVRLQKDGALLPSDYDGGFTIEMWARGDEYRSYVGVFRLFKSNDDCVYLRWNKDSKDGGVLSEGGVMIGGAHTYLDRGIRGWEKGVMNYIATVFTKNADGTWTMSFNRFHARNGIRYESVSVDLPTTFDPAVFTETADFSLGRSHEGRNDAQASYDEVRIWKRPLSRVEMSASAAMGPDAAFDDENGLEKAGSGLLALSGSNGYAGKTTVAEGALSLGAKPAVLPYHRWSFSGNLDDTADIASTVKRTATRQGSNQADITLTDSIVTLPGGTCNTAYLQLVSQNNNLIDVNAGGYTFEFWVRENDVVRWARIFQTAANTAFQHFMAFTADTDTKLAFIAASTGADTDGTTSTELGNFEIGKWYHVAMTVWKDANGGWKVTFSKHDVTTGALLGEETYAPKSDWAPNRINGGALQLGHSASSDAEAQASYDEVRVWNRAFSEEELAYSAKLGPDTLPTFAATAATPASLAADTALVISNGASFYLSGANQTVASLSGDGQLVGPGTLTVTDGVCPGTDGGLGKLFVSGGATLVGTVSCDWQSDGSSDRLVFAPNATYDVSGIRLAVKDAENLPEKTWFKLVDTTGASLTGTFDLSGLPSGLKAKVTADGVSVKVSHGMVLIFR